MLGFLNRKPSITPSVAHALSESYSVHEMRQIDRLGTTIRLDVGSYLTTEGAAGNEVVLLLDGAADVLRDGAVVASVGPGDVVGETAVLTGAPRNATLVATETVHAAVFNTREFASLLETCPRIEVEMRELVDARA